MRLPSSEENVDFVDGIRTFGGSGSATSKTGFAVHGYTCNRSMGKRVFCNSDGDLLIGMLVFFLFFAREYLSCFKRIFVEMLSYELGKGENFSYCSIYWYVYSFRVPFSCNSAE